ncbi:MAG: family N-acetyltransferase [Frankiales bacterium]|nr:family N-acetyltransferase [Frankiales bacterium]
MLEVRPALPSEYAAIGELTATTYLDEGYGDDDYAVILRDVAARAAQATVLVALLDGRLAGTVTVATAGGPFAEQAEPGEAVVRMLVTDPAARGRGVGTALMQSCLDAARAAGCSVVRLSTQASMTSAHRVYERLGFTRTPARDWNPVPDLRLLTYALPLSFCGYCGEPLGHEGCERMLVLEPPRYCSRCRRRMVVQVHPTGWSARCVEHGVLTG